jgi:hypothetical protein
MRSRKPCAVMIEIVEAGISLIRRVDRIVPKSSLDWWSFVVYLEKH